ncbi:DUF397 domain-containing protein [Halostreptopolyspora alba]|uniref:DUF397 domain-containing protein n=1 Tax=Halostreptopolyspora alba TaxID=2487137 RepID=A0A3N0E7A9_9ACTN|nr:DUF397 domain-containing protein [Nocardiopsaceae bacterium YIM 96095]
MRHDTDWFKSSHSAGASNACVEARITPMDVHVRDSTHPHGAVLTVDTPAWWAFLKAVRSDQL